MRLISLVAGGGTYISIGATECMPRVFRYATTATMKSWSLILFVVGATAVGLILLDHKHCVLPGDEDAHEGHNH